MEEKKPMTYLELMAGFKEKGYKLKRYGTVWEKRTKYHLYKIVINPQYRRTLLVTSGFHGEEFNGPISLLTMFDDLVRYAKHKRVRLIVYPCVNPSGFDLHKRYNASNERQNNDFLRYEIKKGKWVSTMRSGETFLTCKVIDSRAKEVRFLKRNVLRYRVPNAVLDIHQDNELEDSDFYTYIFDNTQLYQKIVNKIKKIAQVARNVPALNFENGRKIRYKINSRGFIFLHDGTLTDMFYRLGSEFVVTAETGTQVPLKLIARINLIWAKELIKLISKK